MTSTTLTVTAQVVVSDWSVAPAARFPEPPVPKRRSSLEPAQPTS